jgi:O-antigen biosynthesis protein WbqV
MQRWLFRLQMIAVDVLIAAAALVCAYLISPSKLPTLGFGVDGSLNLAELAAIYAGLAGLYTFLFRRGFSPWRYVSMADAMLLIRIALLTSLSFLAAAWVLDRAVTLPRSALLMAAAFQVGGSIAIRFVRRAVHERAFDDLIRLFALRAPPSSDAPALLLIGPTALADTYLREAARAGPSAYNPIGIVGIEPSEVGQQVRGVRILETVGNLRRALDDLRRWGTPPRAVLFLDDPVRLQSLTPSELGRLRSEGVRLLRLPPIVEMAHQEGARLSVREISVEELLARDPVELNVAPIAALIGGRRVLITGAGGSIGSELARQAAALNCAHLTLLDASESALFEIDRQLGEDFPDLSRRAVLCDVRKGATLNAHFKSERPDLVFHAAALKHVSMVESHPCEGVLTNVMGTANVADAARAAGARQMVLISTDKAVDPANVMGATKRVAEAVIQSQSSLENLRFSAVRFGNVLGSAGSVVPIFTSQIEAGGPVTVTHADMTRFFMTIPEAVQLVLHATAHSADSAPDDARLFLLEMGRPVRILDLAQQMIALSGLRVGEDIDIRIVGLRPGEKLNETLLDENERAEPCSSKILEVMSDAGPITRADIDGLIELAERGDGSACRERLFAMVGAIRATKGRRTPNLRIVAGG